MTPAGNLDQARTCIKAGRINEAVRALRRLVAPSGQGFALFAARQNVFGLLGRGTPDQIEAALCKLAGWDYDYKTDEAALARVHPDDHERILDTHSKLPGQSLTTTVDNALFHGTARPSETP